MGAWSASITGNDTAQDLIEEYKIAFSLYDVETALVKLDECIKKEMFDESDEPEWADYKYSLADFMWKKGILTDEVRDSVIDMIDSGFGLDLWEDAGSKALEERKKVLEKFREKITSEQCAPKKIKFDVYDDIFEDGEYIAVKLKTIVKNKRVGTHEWMLEKRFGEYDGKYVVMRKICSFSKRVSSLVPDMYDHEAIFQFFKGVYDDPQSIDIDKLEATPLSAFGRPYMCTYSKMAAFKRRGCVVIGRKPVGEDAKNIDINDCTCFGWGTWDDPDYQLILAALDLNRH